jgi:hypothetical protein
MVRSDRAGIERKLRLLRISTTNGAALHRKVLIDEERLRRLTRGLGHAPIASAMT